MEQMDAEVLAEVLVEAVADKIVCYYVIMGQETADLVAVAVAKAVKAVKVVMAPEVPLESILILAAQTEIS
jgi:hypothetical protein